MSLMSRPIEIEVRYGETINTGNYESERIDLMARVVLGLDEDHDLVYRAMYNNLKDLAKQLTGRD